MPEQTLSVGSFSLQSRDQDKQMSLIGGLKNRKEANKVLVHIKFNFLHFKIVYRKMIKVERCMM